MRKIVNFVLGMCLLLLIFTAAYQIYRTLPPPEDINACNPDAKMNWLPSRSAVVGYNVYRGDFPKDKPTLMVKLNDKPITSLFYDDCTVEKGKSYYYTVRAVNKQGVESWDSGPVIITVPNPSGLFRSLNP